MLEHIKEHDQVMAEIARVLRPGGMVLIAVPCDMALWPAHDEVVGHVRRYCRRSLSQVVERAGLVIDELWSWNVPRRPIVALHRRNSSGSDLTELHPVVNAVPSGVIRAERHLAVKSPPGVSLMLRARVPQWAAPRSHRFGVAGRCGLRTGTYPHLTCFPNNS